MQQTLEPPVQKCDLQYRLIQVDAALQLGQTIEAIATLDQIDVTAPTEHSTLAQLWERAGMQLKNTNQYSERGHCYRNAMVHYERANDMKSYFQAFKNFCR